MKIAFLWFARLLAFVAYGGVIYAGCVMHPFSPGMFIGLLVAWLIVFGRLFNSPA
jgi:hypothetical protein